MKILLFVTQSHPALPNLKNIQMRKRHLKTNPYYHTANESLKDVQITAELLD